MSKPESPWWQQDTAVTWPLFENVKERRWLPFIRAVGTTICDRGILYALPKWKFPDGSRKHVADYYHKHGLQVTSFLSVCDWKTDKKSVDELIGHMRRHLDEGCDGIHLDMLIDVDDPARTVHTSDAASRAIQRMCDAIHAYPRKPQAIFSGNAFTMQRPFGPALAKLCDIVWIESEAHDDDLDMVRLTRIARSVDDYTKPTWYHWQPGENEESRVQHLANMPKAYYASLLMEGAVFLCNYQYPVPLATLDKAGKKQVKWVFFDINKRWQKAVIQYAKFAKAHGPMLRGAKPIAPVLVAFSPDRIEAANAAMTELLKINIPFNVHVYGKWPFRPLSECKKLRDYTYVVAPDPGPARRAGCRTVFVSAEEVRDFLTPAVRDFCRVEGLGNSGNAIYPFHGSVATRIYAKGKQLFVHMKQRGYTDKADKLPKIGPLKMVLTSSRKIRSAVCLSPDRPGRQRLKFVQEGPLVRMTIPCLEYYNLIVLETGAGKR